MAYVILVLTLRARYSSEAIIVTMFLSPVRAFVLRLSSNESNTGDELTWIAGSVVLSDNPSQQLKYLRKRFGVKQADLARKMDITPSVLSDYEKGRRPSPGVKFIQRYLLSLYELAKSNGQTVVEVAPSAVANVHINRPDKS